LIRKRYYVLFLIPVFIGQVTNLVQFTEHNTFRMADTMTSQNIDLSSWGILYIEKLVAENQ
jgi:hypothetical protein